MLSAILLSGAYLFSYEDFKNEVDTQLYQINQEIQKTLIEDVDLYNLAYLNGKLDVYKSLQEGLDQEPPESHP
jgi:hypothetical protein